MDATTLSRLGCFSLFCAALTVTSCRSTQTASQSIALHSEEVAMKAEILQHIPLGTPIEEAARIMRVNGFDCSLVDVYGNDPPFLFCDLHKTERWPVSRRWMISIQLALSVPRTRGRPTV
jgi:hypothetical protein